MIQSFFFLRLKVPLGHFLLPGNLRGHKECSPPNAHDNFDHGNKFSQLGMFVPNADANAILALALCRG